jgi:transcriptional regulator with XRE-family HTH domain
MGTVAYNIYEDLQYKIRRGSMEDIGWRLKRAREMVGLSRAEATTLLGIHPQYMADIEGGRRTPSMSMLRKVSLAYGMPMWWFLLPRDVEGGMTITVKIPQHLRWLTEKWPTESKEEE